MAHLAECRGAGEASSNALNKEERNETRGIRGRASRDRVGRVVGTDRPSFLGSGRLASNPGKEAVEGRVG